jgi:hypothetical protein
MANNPSDDSSFTFGNWLPNFPNYNLSSSSSRAPSRQTRPVDDVSSDTGEEDEEDYEFAEAILASENEDTNLGCHASLLQEEIPATQAYHYSAPSGPSRQSAETANAQNPPVAAGETFGSNEHVYNPYSPLSSKEYVEQEVAAGRMKRKDTKAKTSIPYELKTPSMGEPNSFAGTPPTYGVRAANPVRLTSAGSETVQHTSQTRWSNNAAALINERLQRRIPPQAQREVPTLQQLTQELNLPIYLTASEMEAGLRARLIQTLRMPFEQLQAPGMSLRRDTAAPSPNVSANWSLGSSPEPVVSNGASLPPQSSPRSRGRAGADGTNPRRRTGLMATMRTVRSTRAASSASVPAAASADDSPPILVRKRRRADRSPQEAIPPPPTRNAIPLNQNGRLSARSALSARTGAFAPRGRVNARTPLHPEQPSQNYQIDIPRMLRTLPSDINRKIMEYVFNINMGTSTPPLRLIPPMDSPHDPHFIFTSELIPRIFRATKRQRLLDIFRNKAPYVPAAIAMHPGSPPMQLHVTNGGHPDYGLPSGGVSYQPRLGRSGRGWPENVLPTEVFDNVIGNLARDDIRQMRLVNHEFEKKVSNSLFRRVVVPFRPEIYGLIVKKDKPVKTVDVKGKGKAKELPFEEDTTGKDVHDGMKVFQAWGPHINQFAMAFEIDEEQLVKPPAKEKEQIFTTFWGTYKWPHPYYNRFEICAILEKKADEYRCMSMALSNLTKAKDLGLSVDSGLGWLVGPDISDRAQLFKNKSRVFGEQLIADSRHDERKDTWDDIIRSFGAIECDYIVPEGTIVSPGSQRLTRNVHGFYELHLYDTLARNDEELTDWDNNDILSTNTTRLQFVDMPRSINGQFATSRPLVFQGVNLSDTPGLGTNANTAVNLRDIPRGPAKDTVFSSARLKPNELVAAQRELLLETEWAQRAFLSSYCMALTDNTETFQHVRTLTIAKLSSRYLGALQRDDFWQALPQLNALTFYVSPDFRDIQKMDTGDVKALDLSPSESAAAFYVLLLKCVAEVPSIKTMNLGYMGGGEQQIGIFGRNKHILPAPLTDCGPRTIYGAHATTIGVSGIIKQNPEEILALPHVEHLTLTNCWIAPPTLKDFVTKLRAPNMQTLTLDSVSLTAHRGFVVDSNEPNPMDQPSFSRLPEGPPRSFDPIVGNFHQQRGSAPHPDNTSTWCWTTNGGRIGSWRNVIDTITPGPTIDLLRWVYQHTDEFAPARQVGALQRIIFKSCGYVRLIAHGQNLDQTALGETVNSPPVCLQKRALDLMPIMMYRGYDVLLGQIVPSLSEEEQEVFRSAFPMRLGWEDIVAAEHVLEDGQPKGGTGRFSGFVEKLVFAEPGNS